MVKDLVSLRCVLFHWSVTHSLAAKWQKAVSVPWYKSCYLAAELLVRLHFQLPTPCWVWSVLELSQILCMLSQSLWTHTCSFVSRRLFLCLWLWNSFFNNSRGLGFSVCNTKVSFTDDSLFIFCSLHFLCANICLLQIELLNWRLWNTLIKGYKDWCFCCKFFIAV